MPAMELTEDEAKEVLRSREQRDRRRWIAEGMFLGAAYLNRCGEECAGGSGDQINPETGQRYGEPYFTMAGALMRRAAYLSANPKEINV